MHRIFRGNFLPALCGGLILLIGCGGNSGPGSQKVITLQGAGATFPDLIYNRWFADYTKKHPNVRVNYNALGSGAGIQQFIDGIPDFGASDAAMSAEEMSKVSEGVQLIPLTAGSIVLAYNLPNAPAEVRLSREAYPKIFLGEITMWNDPAIAASNPGVKLPDLPIKVATRADSSGTTYVFTKHLSEISPAFKEKFGTTKAANWPNAIGANGNPGVAAYVKQTPGAIGYIEVSFAKTLKLPSALLENKAGKYIAPRDDAFTAAFDGAELPDDMILWLPDPAGEGAYPIVSLTWIMVRKSNKDAEKTAALKDVIRYCLTDGQAIAPEMGFVKLPDAMTAKILAAVDNIKP